MNQNVVIADRTSTLSKEGMMINSSYNPNKTNFTKFLEKITLRKNNEFVCPTR